MLGGSVVQNSLHEVMELQGGACRIRHNRRMNDKATNYEANMAGVAAVDKAMRVVVALEAAREIGRASCRERV